MPEYAVIEGQRVELTEWFPAGTQPHRRGEYEIESAFPHRKIFRARWDGRQWMAIPFCIPFGRGGQCRWRGLAHPHGAT